MIGYGQGGNSRKIPAAGAVKPGSRRPLIESYATQDALAARRAALEQAGYSVLVTLNEGELQ